MTTDIGIPSLNLGTLEREHAAYEYVKQHGERVHSLHVAMNSMAKPDADFFVETQIA
jgi:hypothetical protein